MTEIKCIAKYNLPEDRAERVAFKKTQEYRDMLAANKASMLSVYKANRKKVVEEMKKAYHKAKHQERLDALSNEIITKGVAAMRCSANKNYFVFDNGTVWSFKRMQYLTQCKTNDGYRYVCLGGCKRHLVHRLVAEAFIGGQPFGKEIDHINNDRDDNTPSNLQWITHQENINKRKDNR